MKRCEEELSLISTEMHNTLDYWRKYAESIKQSSNASATESSCQYSRGVISLLQQYLLVIELSYSRAQAAFGSILSPVSSSSIMHDSDSSDSSDESTDAYDSDVDD